MLQTIRSNESRRRLFLLAFLTLYLELALIRFTAAEVLYLGYFANFVLISAFLGIGLGFLLAERRADLLRWVPEALLALLAFVVLVPVDVTALRDSAGQLFFGHAGRKLEVPLVLSLPLIFSISAFIFAAIAQSTARCFRHHAPLTAYSIDILGSLAGIAAFTLHSYLGGTPAQWFGLVSLLLILATQDGALKAALVGAGVVTIIVAAAPDHYVRWSPYQRIEVQSSRHGHRLLANGIGHQTMAPVGRKEPIYDFPYTELRQRLGRGRYEDVLVIGAGAGTDVSYALHYGVRRVDAVELDPEILAAGRKFHPARPYADPRVSTHTTDGRAFMEQTDHRYDLIIYALPDSLAALLNLSNIRLESFLFTSESFAKARQLLKPGGVLVLYNYYRRDWLVAKLAAMLKEVFGHAPVVRSYTTQERGKLAALAVGLELRGPEDTRSNWIPSTDNWPFLYMRAPGLPLFYALAMALFILLGLGGVFGAARGKLRDMAAHGPFLLMGAAFLLLETKSIIQFSLLFGSTWVVNSLVFFAILCSVLLANWIVSRARIESPLWPLAALMAALLLHIVLPLELLLKIPDPPLRYLVASAVLFSPIFCANIVFGCLFKDTAKSYAAFGWNLIGTMIGGALEYTSLAVGYRALGSVVAALYAATAVWALARHRATRGTAPSA